MASFKDPIQHVYISNFTEMKSIDGRKNPLNILSALHRRALYREAGHTSWHVSNCAAVESV